MPKDHAIYGIIGFPLAHTLSPVMHNAAFKEFGVEAVYQTFPLHEEELDDFLKDLHKNSSPIFGLNVTVPYKEKVIPYLDTLSPLVQKAMAVNTIVINKERKLIGYNTDAPGFLAHLAELKFNTKNKKIALLGAGGSARAILTALCLIPERPASIKIYNRTFEKARALAEELKSRMDAGIVEVVMSIDDLQIQEADLLINTTSVGLNPADPSLIEEDLLHADLLVYDLIYNPKETELLRMARERSAQTANGLGMLYYQGVLSLQHWAEKEIEEPIKRKMREALVVAAGFSPRSAG